MAGAWSDRHGRKFILALPIFGQVKTILKLLKNLQILTEIPTFKCFQVLANITFMLNYAFLTELPFEALSLEFVNEGKQYKLKIIEYKLFTG